jgi:hypothetical protein
MRNVLLGLWFFIGAVVLLALWIASTTGAEWPVVGSALGNSCFVVMGAVLVNRIVHPFPFTFWLPLCTGGIYICWWAVLDSIALQHVRNLHPLFMEMEPLPWWCSWWFKWATLALLLALVSVVCKRVDRSRRIYLNPWIQR